MKSNDWLGKMSLRSGIKEKLRSGEVAISVSSSGEAAISLMKIGSANT